MDENFIFTEDIQAYCSAQLEPSLPFGYSLNYELLQDYDTTSLILKLSSPSMCQIIGSSYIETLFYKHLLIETLHIENDNNEIIGVLICEFNQGRLDLHLICGKKTISGIGSILMTTFLLAVKKKQELGYYLGNNMVYLDVAGGFVNTAVCLYDKFGFVENPVFDATKQLEMILKLDDITEKDIMDIYEGKKRYNNEPLCKLERRQQYKRNMLIREDERFNPSHYRRSIQEAKAVFNAKMDAAAIGKAPRTPGGAIGKVPRVPGSAIGKSPRTPGGVSGKAPRTPGGAIGKAPRTPGGAIGKAPRTPSTRFTT